MTSKYRGGRREQGFTLVEMLVVMVIIVILSVVAMARMGRQDSQTAAAGLARGIYALSQQARYQAMTGGKQVQIFVQSADPTAQLRVAIDPGNGAVINWGPFESNVNAHLNAQVVNVTAGATPGTAPPGLMGGTVAVLTFFPNGQLVLNGAGGVTGATIYVADQLLRHPQRVLLYGRTGFAKVIDR